MPLPPQPATQSPIQASAALPVPAQQPVAQLPAQQPGAAAASEANPLREVAERVVGEGRGLR
jgi:hypothetical protein